MISMFLSSILMFHYVNVPVANMREAATDKAEIVSQGYFSEKVNILEENGDWTKIETLVDHYPGWVKSNQLIHMQIYETTAHVNRLMAHIYDVADTVYGPITTLPFDSALKVMDSSHERWIKVAMPDGAEAYIQRGDVTFNPQILNRDQMVAFSKQFLGLPYTWGGRSSFGYDCSGFVQMLYRQMGISLPRDSKDQAKWLEPIEINALQPGDLIYFGLAEDKIRHVGMYIGSGQFIHATVAENAPYIHTSKLSDPDWNGSGKWTYRAARTFKIDLKS